MDGLAEGVEAVDQLLPGADGVKVLEGLPGGSDVFDGGVGVGYQGEEARREGGDGGVRRALNRREPGANCSKGIRTWCSTWR